MFIRKCFFICCFTLLFISLHPLPFFFFLLGKTVLVAYYRYSKLCCFKLKLFKFMAYTNTILFSFSSGGQKTKIRCQRALFLWEAFVENSLPCFFCLLEAACVPWLMASHHISFSSSVSIITLLSASPDTLL